MTNEQLISSSKPAHLESCLAYLNDLLCNAADRMKAGNLHIAQMTVSTVKMHIACPEAYGLGISLNRDLVNEIMAMTGIPQVRDLLDRVAKINNVTIKNLIDTDIIESY